MGGGSTRGARVLTRRRLDVLKFPRGRNHTKGKTREERGRNENVQNWTEKTDVKEHPEPGGDAKTGTKRGQGDEQQKTPRPRTVREKHPRRRERGRQKSWPTAACQERSRRRHTERARKRPESDRAVKTKGGQKKEAEQAETRRQRRLR